MRIQSSLAASAWFSIAWLLVGPVAAALPAPEAEPTLPAKELAPASVALSGSGYAVNSPTQVGNFLGQFSIRSNWGEVDAVGGVLLALRIAEMPALAELDKVSHSKYSPKRWPTPRARRSTAWSVSRSIPWEPSREFRRVSDACSPARRTR